MRLTSPPSGPITSPPRALRSAELKAFLARRAPDSDQPRPKLVALRVPPRETPVIDLLANLSDEPVSPAPQAVRPKRITRDD